MKCAFGSLIENANVSRQCNQTDQWDVVDIDRNCFSEVTMQIQAIGVSDIACLLTCTILPLSVSLCLSLSLSLSLPGLLIM